MAEVRLVKRLPILFGLRMSAAACTSQTVMNQSQLPVAPPLTVERFLQAANTRDLETISRLFGNDDGPIGDSESREEVELRMNVIAEILQHDDYEVVSERVWCQERKVRATGSVWTRRCPRA